jgi:hypothetical protein
MAKRLAGLESGCAPDLSQRIAALAMPNLAGQLPKMAGPATVSREPPRRRQAGAAKEIVDRS